ncbi:uncharacterized protein VTP21DRAFT_3691 [Calcarisporiella thermophila]|uniref:uncharacterized protein n=1 Tax=Calcarisporiella thermophila TaxID=911321 RepID=UPI0037426697
MSPHFRRRNTTSQLNIMVCGPSGVGKTSFIRSFCQTLCLARGTSSVSSTNSTTSSTTASTATNPSASEHSIDATKLEHLMEWNEDPAPTVEFVATGYDILEERERIHIRFIDTPGLVMDWRLEHQVVDLVRYVETQFDITLAEETKIRRNPKAFDTQIHTCLYFIDPQNRGLTENDIRAIRWIGKRTNVMVVIAKSDTLTLSQANAIKRRVRADIQRLRLPVFKFHAEEAELLYMASRKPGGAVGEQVPDVEHRRRDMEDLDEDMDSELDEENRELQRLCPFTVFSAETGGMLGRQYPWGFISCLEPSHCDLSVLRSVLLSSHRQDLKLKTQRAYYERYRTERLLARKASLGLSKEERQRLIENLASV